MDYILKWRILSTIINLKCQKNKIPFSTKADTNETFCIIFNEDKSYVQKLLDILASDREPSVLWDWIF